MNDLLAKALSDALSLATEQDSSYGYSDEPGSPYVLLLADALRDHPDRLRIAASLLTAEDVARALVLCEEGHRPMVPTIEWAADFLAAEHMHREAHTFAAAILAALSGEHSDA
jgi:hypothetical protein